MTHYAAHCVDRTAARGLSVAATLETARACAHQLARDARSRTAGLVVLETCERFDLFCDSAAAAHTRHVLDACGLSVVTRTGHDAARYLFRVAAGLESRVVGEPHVLGQVRRALGDAEAGHTASPALRNLFAAAVTCGRRVRTQVAFERSSHGYAGRAVAAVLQRLDGRDRADVAVLGTGQMACAVITEFATRSDYLLTIVARHPERATALAAATGARVRDLAVFAEGAEVFDALVSAIDPLRPVVDHQLLRRVVTTVAIDLGAAPGIDPEADHHAEVEVVRLPQLGVTASGDELLRAAAIVERELQRLTHTRPQRVVTRGIPHTRPRSARVHR